MTCDPKALLEAAKCYRCIPKPVMRSSMISLLCEWANNLTPPEPPVECSEPILTAWLNDLAVSAPALQLPSNATLTALCDFCRALRLAGIDDKFLFLNPIIPPENADSFALMAYPLIHDAGSFPWTNHNFVAADLGLDGLAGGGAVRETWYNTGAIPEAEMQANWPDGGMTVVESVTSTADPPLGEVEIGEYYDLLAKHFLSCNNEFFGLSPRSTGAYGFSFDLSAARPDTIGIYSLNRSDVDSMVVWFGNTGSYPLAQIINDVYDQSGSGFGDVGMTFMGMWDLDLSAPVLFTEKTVSFVALHRCLTETEVDALYLAIQDLRTAFGGGTV